MENMISEISTLEGVTATNHPDQAGQQQYSNNKPAIQFSIFHPVSNYVEGPESLSAVYEGVIEMVQLAEQLGFSGVYFNEGHGNAPNYKSSNARLLMAALSQVTKTIKLGVAVTPLGIKDPRFIAEDIVMLDSLTQGRMDFGLASGYKDHYIQFGLNAQMSKEIYTLKLQMLQAFLKGDTISINNEIARANNAKLGALPEYNDIFQRLFQGTISAEGAHIIGEQGYGLAYTAKNTEAGHAPDYPAQIRKVADAYQSGWSKSPSSHLSRPPIKINVPCHIIGPNENILDKVGDYWDTYWECLTHVPPRTRHCYFNRYLNDGISLFGTKEKVCTNINNIRDNGITNLMCLFNFGNIPREMALDNMRRFSEEIMPLYVTVC